MRGRQPVAARMERRYNFPPTSSAISTYPPATAKASALGLSRTHRNETFS